MGPHLIRVTYSERIFSTTSLLGGDDTVCQAVRFLAPYILTVDQESEESVAVAAKREVMVSFSLRKQDVQTLKAIATELQKLNLTSDCQSSHVPDV